jgi:hypothetical protein
LVLVEELPVVTADTLEEELPDAVPVPVKPVFALRFRFFVLLNELPSLSFQVMTRGIDDRSLAVKVISKLEKSSAASEPIAYCA